MQQTAPRPALRTRRTALRLLAALPLAGFLAVTAQSRTDDGAQRVALAAPLGTAWDTMRAGGQVALVRHADAPGVGDPESFALGDCSTQRNLSDGGRAQAARIGAAFRKQQIAVDQVLTSGWCRCVETATLAFGTAEVWSPLNSFFRDDSSGAAQTAEVRTRVADWTGPGTLVLVTHQVNVTALTDIFPASGEIVVLTPAPERAVGFSIAGRVAVP
jgi:phosphohistidine phosphatase SixA